MRDKASSVLHIPFEWKIPYVGCGEVRTEATAKDAVHFVLLILRAFQLVKIGFINIGNVIAGEQAQAKIINQGQGSQQTFNDRASLCKRRSLVQSKESFAKKVEANRCKSIKPIPLPISSCLSRQYKASSWVASGTCGRFFNKLNS